LLYKSKFVYSDNMKPEFTAEKANFWVDAPASFTISEICPDPEDLVFYQTVEHVFINNDKFLRIKGDVGKEDQYISKKTLTIWLYRLNIRLIEIQHRSYILDQKKFLLLANSLNQYTTWERLPKEIAEFGQEIGLLTYTFDHQFFFPLAYVFQFIKTDVNLLYYLFEEECFVLSLLNYIDEELKIPFPTSVQDWLEKLMISSELTEKQRTVLYKREGWYTGKKQSLEGIAQDFGVTRERIRQIEIKARQKIAPVNKPKKYLYEILIFQILQAKGSVIIEGENNIVGFVCKLLNIPLDCTLIPHACIIGEQKLNWFEIFHYLKRKDGPKSQDFLNLLYRKILISAVDLTRISQSLFQESTKHLRKGDYIIFTLRAIGKPAHYSFVYDKLSELYPQVEISERSVHAHLDRLAHGEFVVWIGKKGTYALKEWGYEKPDKTIFDTIADIVRLQYSKTQKPVSRLYIESQIGKYRENINPTSFEYAIYFNEEILKVGKNLYIPKIEGATTVKSTNFSTAERDIHEGINKFRKSKEK